MDRDDGWRSHPISGADALCHRVFLQFLVAGLTGISHASAALDWQTKNSYFLVAHFHFVAVGAIVFAILGGIDYWFPKMSGRMLSERLGQWTFWLMVIGFNLTFIIQHFLGLLGMPRRVYTYPDLPHWGWMNMLSTSGVFFMTAASLILVWNILAAFFRPKTAGDNPWHAGPSNGPRPRRPRMKISSRCPRSVVGGRCGTWPIPLGRIR